jgi:hypothetical protein
MSALPADQSPAKPYSSAGLRERNVPLTHILGHPMAALVTVPSSRRPARNVQAVTPPHALIELSTQPKGTDRRTDRTEGAIKKTNGAIEEDVGKMIGDVKTEPEVKRRRSPVRCRSHLAV